jgi:hypothetical protein
VPSSEPYEAPRIRILRAMLSLPKEDAGAALNQMGEAGNLVQL